MSAHAPAADSAAKLARMEEALAATDMELLDLRQRVFQTHVEIAALRHPQAEYDRLVAAEAELAAIIAATESATNEVLGAVESIERAAEQVRKKATDPEVEAQVNAILDGVVKILEASNFQDITGQRITKVMKTLGFVEERVAAMIRTWGVDAFNDLPTPVEVSDNEEAHLLNGPQMEGKAISQADIDSLFD